MSLKPRSYRSNPPSRFTVHWRMRKSHEIVASFKVSHRAIREARLFSEKNPDDVFEVYELDQPVFVITQKAVK